MGLRNLNVGARLLNDARAGSGLDDRPRLAFHCRLPQQQRRHTDMANAKNAPSDQEIRMLAATLAAALIGTTKTTQPSVAYQLYKMVVAEFADDEGKPYSLNNV
jgi:hypothetical protein